jgi:hypothetical protein
MSRSVLINLESDPGSSTRVSADERNILQRVSLDARMCATARAAPSGQRPVTRRVVEQYLTVEQAIPLF